MSMVRISDSAHKTLKEIAANQGSPMQAVLEDAIDAHRRRLFLEGLNDDFAALRKDESAWREEGAERAVWENTLLDGQDK